MLPELLLLGAIIGSNNFATSLALGSLGQEIRRWRVIAVFGLFEFTIPLLGLWLGQRASGALSDFAGRLGPALLVGLGLWSIAAALRSRRESERLADRVTTWGGLMLLSAGLSVDNLIVGFSIGLGETEPLLLAGTIALFSMSFAYIGLKLGGRARDHHRKAAEIATGALLIGLGAALAAGLI